MELTEKMVEASELNTKRNFKKANGNKSASVTGYKDLLPEEVQAEYDKACEFVDIEIVKAEGLGRAVEILKYERDNLWKYFKEKESL